MFVDDCMLYMGVCFLDVCVCVVEWDLVMTFSPTVLRDSRKKVKIGGKRKVCSPSVPMACFLFSVFLSSFLVSRSMGGQTGESPHYRVSANLLNAYSYAWECYLLELPTDRPTDQLPNRPTGQPTNRQINQPADRPTDRSIAQPSAYKPIRGFDDI